MTAKMAQIAPMIGLERTRNHLTHDGRPNVMVARWGA
jgi:hypothetical protein